MPFWEGMRRVASQLEDRVDATKRIAERIVNQDTPIHIQPYIGYGNRNHVRLRGRLLENHRVTPATDNDSSWRNLVNFYHRFNSDEIPNAAVTAQIGDQTQTVITSKEGYFMLELTLDQPLPADQTWHELRLHFDDGERQHDTTGRFITPSETAQFGVISDLDDTVVQTDVTNLIKMLANTLFKNARTRLPFPGVASFYQALQHGTTEAIFNPIYYVSNSPWNLYDLITDFFRVRGIPEGPIFLRDFGLSEDKILASDSHKLNEIKRLLDFHPDLPFILIGDSGEHDAAIYLEIVQLYPGRILAIYIRDVDANNDKTKRAASVNEIARQVAEAGSEMLLIPNTEAAARHAIDKGFINPNMLTSIAQDAAEDVRPTNPIEALIEGKPDSPVE